MKTRTKNPKLKSGMKVKVIANTANHNQPIGSIVTLTGVNLNNYGDCNARNSAGQIYTFYTTDFVVLAMTKEEILKAIEELKIEIKTEETKLQFLKETGQEEYDEDEFQAYQVLKLVASKKTTQLEKAKQIVKILRG